MKKQPQLKHTTEGLMISTALFFDAFQAVIQLIPGLGQILASLVGIYALLTFWLWFRLHGIKFSTPKRAGTMGGGFLIELIPLLNALPAWTLAVALIIADLRVKEAADKFAGDGENKKAA